MISSHLPPASTASMEASEKVTEMMMSGLNEQSGGNDYKLACNFVARFLQLAQQEGVITIGAGNSSGAEVKKALETEFSGVITGLQQENKGLIAEVENIAKTVTRLTTELTDAGAATEDLKADLEAEIDRLRKNLTDAKTAAGINEGKMRDLETELTTAKTAATTASAGASQALTTAQNDLAAAKTAAAAEKAKLDTEIARLQKELTDAKTAATTASQGSSQELIDTKSDLADEKAKVQKARVERNALQAKLDAVKAAAAALAAALS
ncbi:hypothetical protein OAN22_02310 [Alphaproteobacteria bacterium]|nr:hypothetical protein [Alphaproteobacteria bacterium]